MNKFVKNGSNPIFGGPTLGTMFDVYIQPWSGEFTALAHPKYRMDVSWRPQHSLAVAFSEDGLHWTAPEITLPPNPATGWEDNVNRNCVLKVGGKYLMWYTGQFHRNRYSAIGIAESDDGIRFRRVNGGMPLLVPERKWEGESVMNPCVLFENGIYRMYYAAGETVEPNVLALAESSDGVTWRRDMLNPIYVCNRDKEYEQNRVGGCQVVFVQGLGYLMFYIGYKNQETACICCALSKDGRTNWRRCRENPLVTPDPGTWDEDSCYKPTVLYDPAQQGWHLWYNGRRRDEEYIGEAFMAGTFTEGDFI